MAVNPAATFRYGSALIAQRGLPCQMPVLAPLSSGWLSTKTSESQQRPGSPYGKQDTLRDKNTRLAGFLRWAGQPWMTLQPWHPAVRALKSRRLYVTPLWDLSGTFIERLYGV